MPRPYSMGQRNELAEAMRDRLLDAVADVVAERGGAGLTMQAVAESADVALRTVYNHFPTKESLAIAAYDRLASRTVEAVEALRPTGSPREDLRACIATFLDSYTGETRRRSVIAGVPGIPELDVRVEQVRTWRRERLAKLVRAAAAENDLRLPSSDAVALTFLVTAYATWETLLLQNKMSAAAAKRLLLETVDAALFAERAR